MVEVITLVFSEVIVVVLPPIVVVFSTVLTAGQLLAAAVVVWLHQSQLRSQINPSIHSLFR